ncbi:AAA family ATPase [Sorangium sp. So ce327]|uniref:AAA family ATPase n=1 Tax=Sorangium sp. So ce327 TaxID=3133301 RepID=UPI003F63576E
MITRFEIDGFKSLRDFAVDLEPLTVFVGPNGAGKSNLLEAIGLLGRLSFMSLEEAFKLGRGRVVDQFSRSGGEAGRTIRFAIEVSLRSTPAPFQDGGPPLPVRYRYELVIERRARPSGVEELVVSGECLRALADKDGPPRREIILRHEDEDGRERRVLIAPEYESWAGLNYRCPRTHAALAALKTGSGTYHINLDFPKELTAERVTLVKEYADFRNTNSERGWRAVINIITDDLSRFSLLQLDPARLRDSSERTDSIALAPDASNLPTILADLPAPTLGEIRADLVSLIPGLAGFDVVPDDDDLRIEFKLSGGERLPARLASDGTLRGLALLTALRVEPRPSIVGVEEPENGIYPGRLRTLLSLLREITIPGDEASPDSAQPATQLLLTSHSPVVLAAFRDRPEHLRFMDLVRRDGQLVTRARAVGQLNAPGDGAHIVSLREVDALLQAAASEAAE